MDRQGRALGSAGPATDYVSVQLSPDGSSVAYCARDQDLGTNDVYVLDLQRDAEKAPDDRPPHRERAHLDP